MIFALLFIMSFLIGAVIYYNYRHWITSVLIPILVFVISIIATSGSSSESEYSMTFLLSFGISIIFFSSLLGTYIIETRIFHDQDDNVETADEEAEKLD